MLEVIKEKPPIYEQANKQFGVEWDDGVIFTYGDDVYCKYDIAPQKWVHETVHIHQQGDNPKAWWDKYFKDEDFRLKQEMEAYAAEALWIKNNVKDRNYKAKLIFQISCDIASPMYGSLIKQSEAWSALK